MSLLLTISFRKTKEWKLQSLQMHRVIIPVSSPYIEVRMNTSGPYALVKVRLIFLESAHPRDTQVTRTLYTSRTQLTSKVYVRTLCAQFTRHVQDLQAYFTPYKLRPHIRAQSMPDNYVYNLRAQLTRTTYVLVWRAQVTIDVSGLCVQPTCLTYAYNLCLSLVRTYYTMWFDAHVFIIRISTQ